MSRKSTISFGVDLTLDKPKIIEYTEDNHMEIWIPLEIAEQIETALVLLKNRKDRTGVQDYKIGIKIC
jgi:hypothetical protein